MGPPRSRRQDGTKLQDIYWRSKRGGVGYPGKEGEPSHLSAHLTREKERSGRSTGQEESQSGGSFKKVLARLMGSP